MSFSLWPWFAGRHLNETKELEHLQNQPCQLIQGDQKNRLSAKCERYFSGPLCKKSFLAGWKETARFKPALGTEHGCICNPRATGRSGCTPAEPYPPSATHRLRNNNPKFNTTLAVFLLETTSFKINKSVTHVVRSFCYLCP
jgi:hypothetical protein